MGQEFYNTRVMAVSRKNEYYTAIRISEPQFSGVWMSIARSKDRDVSKGDVVNVDITQKDKYYNFTFIESENTNTEKNVSTCNSGGSSYENGMAIGNAKTNACNIVVALLNAGKIENTNTAKAYIKDLAKFIHEIDISSEDQTEG